MCSTFMLGPSWRTRSCCYDQDARSRERRCHLSVDWFVISLVRGRDRLAAQPSRRTQEAREQGSFGSTGAKTYPRSARAGVVSQHRREDVPPAESERCEAQTFPLERLCLIGIPGCWILCRRAHGTWTRFGGRGCRDSSRSQERLMHTTLAAGWSEASQAARSDVARGVVQRCVAQPRPLSLPRTQTLRSKPLVTRICSTSSAQRRRVEN